VQHFDVRDVFEEKQALLRLLLELAQQVEQVAGAVHDF